MIISISKGCSENFMRLCTRSKGLTKKALGKGHSSISVSPVPRPKQGLLAPEHSCQEKQPHTEAAPGKQSLGPCPCHRRF